jgi:N-hydroxyarylamine O-acetyltransferase
VKRATVAAVLDRLGAEAARPDLLGLRAVYAAWCGAVPFDNVLKLIHLTAGRAGPLPGSTADDFFEAWLEDGVGGTCWAGNQALHDLLEALGFDVARAIATMMPTPEIKGPNHGTVIVTVDGDRWIADASILSGVPIRIPAAGETIGETENGGRLPRFEWLDGSPAVIWQALMAPAGFPCRIDLIGASSGDWDALHQRTAAWSPFNFQLSARVGRGDGSVGISSGQRFRFDADGTLSVTPLDLPERVRFLVEELGISEELAGQVPDDRPTPPRPEGR